MKYFIQTFGCQMNVADANLIASHLERRGMKPAASREAADLIVLNTCTVRFDAEHKALSWLGRLRPLKRANPALRIVVAGCAAQRLGEDLRKRFPIVDLVLGAREIERAGEILDRAFPPGSARPPVPPRRAVLPARDKESPATAFVTVTRGCGNHCAYCIVPHVRGPERSRPADEIIAEIEGYAADGYKDVTLLGQNVNAWRGASAGGAPADFPDLLARVDRVAGIERVRFMTSHPKDLGPRLIEAMAGLGKVCGHLHLPLQSGSDRVLSAMNRGYTAARYGALVDRIRGRLPDLRLTTDILVGFPGETEDDFRRTLELVQNIGFHALFAYAYSPREDTASWKLSETVSAAEKDERLRQVQAAAARLSVLKNSALTGTVERVLVEKTARGTCTGRTRSNLKVFFPAPAGSAIAGAFVDVTITGAKTNTLLGELKRIIA